MKKFREFALEVTTPSALTCEFDQRMETPEQINGGHMSRDEYRAKSKEAASRFQTYARSRQSDLAEQMQGTNPNSGWGDSRAAEHAHDVAITMYHYVDEHFLNCRIPEDYGSPRDLKHRLETFEAMLNRDIQELEAIRTSHQGTVPETVGLVLQSANGLRLAVEDAIADLSEAELALPGAAGSQSPGRNVVTIQGAPPVPVAHSVVEPSPLDTVQAIAEKFPDVLRTLSNRRKPKAPVTVENEYDVQYIFEALLTVPFDDLRPEESGPSVAGGGSRADTLLKTERTVVEYKCTRAGLDTKELRRQIADDFLLYGQNSEFDRLFIFVYDKARVITNRKGFETDLSRDVTGLKEVRVVVRD